MFGRRTLSSFALALLAAAPAAMAQQHDHAAARPTIAWNAATKTATYALIAGAPGAKSPFNFNGYVDGELTVVVPVGATVVMNFVNEDGVPHSAAVIEDKDPMPTEAPNAAIPRAYTIKAVEGMNQGEKDVMRFKTDVAGRYRIFCGVPGHGLSGMWIRLRVDATATEPRLETAPAAKSGQ